MVGFSEQKEHACSSFCRSVCGSRLRNDGNQLTINVTAVSFGQSALFALSVNVPEQKLIELNKASSQQAPLCSFARKREKQMRTARFSRSSSLSLSPPSFQKCTVIRFGIIRLIYPSDICCREDIFSRRFFTRKSDSESIGRDFEPLGRARRRMDDSIRRALIFPTDPHRSRGSISL